MCTDLRPIFKRLPRRAPYNILQQFEKKKKNKSRTQDLSNETGQPQVKPKTTMSRITSWIHRYHQHLNIHWIPQCCVFIIPRGPHSVQLTSKQINILIQATPWRKHVETPKLHTQLEEDLEQQCREGKCEEKRKWQGISRELGRIWKRTYVAELEKTEFA